MSWIQNFFQKFIKDKEDEYAEYDIHNKQQERSFPPKIHEGGQHLDTKISYQYPKGKLHLQVKAEVPTTKTVKPDRQKRIEHRSELKSSEPKSIVENKISAPSTKKKPFQLTEVPSPIFGLSRPARHKEKVVEHELSHFLEDEIEDQFNSISYVMAKDAVPEVEMAALETAVGLSEVSEKIEVEPIVDTLKFGPVVETIEVETVVEAIEVEAVVESFEVETVVETSEVETVVETSEVETVVETSEVETVDETSEVETVDETSEVETVDETSEVETVVETSEVETAVEINEVGPVVETIEVETVVETFEVETAVEINEVGPVDEAIVDEPAIETKMEVSNPESRELYTPKRSHLPFNVMMLKQDKVKWEENKRRRLMPTEVPSEKAIVETIVVPAESNDIESRESAETTVEVWSDAYEFPQMNLLSPPVKVENDTEWLTHQQELLNQTLKNFNIGAKVVNVTQGPAVTRFEVQPEPGVKVNKITNLSDDIKLSLAARDIRIEAPIPGKHTIGIEVPNQKSRPVLINEIIQSPVFRESSSPLTAVLGLDISGKPIVTDLKKMPHGLIAGATGSGKSVCINTIIVSLLFKASPEDVKLLLIDPKMVELAPYNRIPHLVSPVITDVKAATAALKWAVDEMERRYELFAHTGVRDINRFNELAIKHKQYSDKLPFIVIIIDELADLMMMSPADVEEAICRIAQKARACGIHLIVATQRPSVDVITGLIKANIPTRIAFSVSSQVDSRTIIDISGAEKLLGRGDMLFLENGSSKPVRLQGTYVSDEEIDLVVGHVRDQREPDYLFEQEELLKKAQITEDEDELFFEACEFIIEQGLASTSSLQRRFKIGYNRAARLMDMLESNGFITSANGSKPREVLITESDLESLHDAGTIN